MVLVGTRGAEDRHAAVVAANIAAAHVARRPRARRAHRFGPTEALAEQAADVLEITGKDPVVVSVDGPPLDRLLGMASSIGASLVVLEATEARPRTLESRRTGWRSTPPARCSSLRRTTDRSPDDHATPGTSSGGIDAHGVVDLQSETAPTLGAAHDTKELQVKPFMKYGGLVASVILIVLGIASIYTGLDGHAEVRDTLKQEQIVGTPDMDKQIANKPVDTGADAKLFADGMRLRALEASSAQVYPRWVAT